MRISDWSSDVCSSDLDAEDPLGPRGRQGAAILLLLLRRGGQRGDRRYPHRRIPRRARGHPARRRQLAEPGARPRADRRRLRAGHGLAHHRGPVVGRPGPAAHPPPPHPQHPAPPPPAPPPPPPPPAPPP